jgi:hypothetical protein
MATDRIVRHATPSDDEIEEEWWREVDDMLRGMTATKWPDGLWQLWVELANVLREEPLESEMRRGMESALSAVPGVTDVREGDREIWDVDGTPSPEALIEAAAVVVDALVERAHQLGY